MKISSIKLKTPEAKCVSPNCPFHGTLSLRGAAIDGTVVSDKMQKTVVVKWDFMKRYPKYERFAKASTKVSAHNPECINAKIGDRVKIAECRKISKSKNYVVIEKM